MSSRGTRRAFVAAAAVGASWLLAAQTAALLAQRRAATPVSGYRVVNAYPHDPDAYTQGLIYRGGFLYESTGRNGQSTLRKVKLETGAVVQQRRIDAAHFAEGLAEWKGRLYQLTWQSNVAFVYDLATFAPVRTLRYPGEGWGLTAAPDGLILSDGTADLRVLDPETFREIRRVTVRDAGVPIDQLNELEFVRGEVWANVWHTDRIARIAPQTGRVVGWIDLSGLMSTYRLDAEAVLNGIAYDAATQRLFVTGKLWPRLFEIQVVPGQARPVSSSFSPLRRLHGTSGGSTSPRLLQKTTTRRQPMTANVAPSSVVRYDVISVSRVAACSTPWNALPEACSSVEGHTLRDRSRSHVCMNAAPMTSNVKQAFAYHSGTSGRWSGKTATLIG